eukprot:m.67720 g.67720  ORF g.67720 m.67720 type:complete len:404 (-) comp11911_c0_seq1:16-1227(-)
MTALSRILLGSYRWTVRIRSPYTSFTNKVPIASFTSKVKVAGIPIDVHTHLTKPANTTRTREDEMVVSFSKNPLDRADELRKSEEALQEALSHSGGLYLPMYKLNPLINAAEDGDGLGWLRLSQNGNTEGVHDSSPVLLGTASDGNETVPYFAMDVSHYPTNDQQLLGIDAPMNFAFKDSRKVASSLSIPDTGILAQARSLLSWHSTHRFCSQCGSHTEAQKGGYVRVCTDCEAHHFPRTDPCVIMLVVDEENDTCLLGRGKAKSFIYYSCLAGFIDQGETLEEAVRREVKEESGIDVGEVSYFKSQPWPFPSSLMFGCFAKALSRDVVIDYSEMEDIKWFSREDVKTALQGQNSQFQVLITVLNMINFHRNLVLQVPERVAIAHHMMHAWVHNTTKQLTKIL